MRNIERRRYMGQPTKDFLKRFDSQVIRVDEEKLNGYAAYLKVYEVNYPLMVGEKGAEICVSDAGYSTIEFLPDDENWRLCGVYDNHGKIVEWYFDITKKNAVDEVRNPYFEDLYLDIALMPDGRVIILDEDELLSAYENGEINDEEFSMAHSVKDELIKQKIVDIAYLETLCSKLLALF